MSCQWLRQVNSLSFLSAYCKHPRPLFLPWPLTVLIFHCSGDVVELEISMDDKLDQLARAARSPFVRPPAGSLWPGPISCGVFRWRPAVVTENILSWAECPSLRFLSPTRSCALLLSALLVWCILGKTRLLWREIRIGLSRHNDDKQLSASYMIRREIFWRGTASSF